MEQSRTTTSSTTPPPFHDIHQQALEKGEKTYKDPQTGYTVMTEISHLERGYCCGNTCRHCPFKYENVGKNSRFIREQAKQIQDQKATATIPFDKYW